MNILAVAVTGRPRLFFGAAVGVLAAIVFPHAWSPLTRAILAWDLGCVVFLVLVANLFTRERDMARDAAASVRCGEPAAAREAAFAEGRRAYYRQLA